MTHPESGGVMGGVGRASFSEAQEDQQIEKGLDPKIVQEIADALDVPAHKAEQELEDEVEKLLTTDQVARLKKDRPGLMAALARSRLARVGALCMATLFAELPAGSIVFGQHAPTEEKRGGDVEQKKIRVRVMGFDKDGGWCKPEEATEQEIDPSLLKTTEEYDAMVAKVEQALAEGKDPIDILPSTAPYFVIIDGNTYPVWTVDGMYWEHTVGGWRPSGWEPENPPTGGPKLQPKENEPKVVVKVTDAEGNPVKTGKP